VLEFKVWDVTHDGSRFSILLEAKSSLGSQRRGESSNLKPGRGDQRASVAKGPWLGKKQKGPVAQNEFRRKRGRGGGQSQQVLEGDRG